MDSLSCVFASRRKGPHAVVRKGTRIYFVSELCLLVYELYGLTEEQIVVVEGTH